MIAFTKPFFWLEFPNSRLDASNNPFNKQSFNYNVLKLISLWEPFDCLVITNENTHLVFGASSQSICRVLRLIGNTSDCLGVGHFSAVKRLHCRIFTRKGIIDRTGAGAPIYIAISPTRAHSKRSLSRRSTFSQPLVRRSRGCCTNDAAAVWRSPMARRGRSRTGLRSRHRAVPVLA